MKKVFALCTLILFSLVLGSAVAYAIDVNPYIPSAGVFIASFIPIPNMAGSLMDAVALNQLVETVLIKRLDNTDMSFLDPIPNKNNYVNNNVIKLNDIGADPNVLIDNTVYPIASAQRVDTSSAISLKKLDTENTKITEDELYALPYDKKSSVIDSHQKALLKAQLKLGLYSLAPQAHSDNTPIVLTTGENDGNGRKMLTIKDLIKLKLAYDKLDIPIEDRNIVLASEHIGDLLLIDNSFRDRYNSIDTGKVIKRMYGFNVYENVFNPVYAPDGTKKAYGAASEGTDRNASTAYFSQYAVKARGTVEMFYRDAKTDPENRASMAGFRVHYIVIPIKQVGFGAIISANV